MAVPPKYRRVCFWLIYAMFLGLLAETGARAFWKVRGVPFLTAHRQVHLSFYPSVGRTERDLRDDGEDCFDILLLGGSALHADYGDIARLLRERLIRETKRCVRIHNLAAPAHTSLDSYYKYRHLAGLQFDLVVFYHGINELRANNCSRSLFRPDYSHLSWYRLINDFEARSDSRWFVLPYTLEFVALKVADRVGWSNSLPTHRPDAGSLDYGCDIKTAASFRRNLGRILDLAILKEEPVLLLSFAFHIPEDYTEQRFEDKALDYTAHTVPIELWGRPACVEAGIEAHNKATAEAASRSGQILFADQDNQIPKQGRYFNDVCHFTHEGCEAFVDNILESILGMM
jgi:hypothetical protein